MLLTGAIILLCLRTARQDYCHILKADKIKMCYFTKNFSNGIIIVDGDIISETLFMHVDDYLRWRAAQPVIPWLGD